MMAYMSAVPQLGHVQRDTSRDLDVFEDNGRATPLVLDSGCSIGKGAASTGANGGCQSGSGQAGKENERIQHCGQENRK